MRLIGSDICVNCREAKQFLQNNNIPFVWFDITENTQNMRFFLHLRDTLPVFDDVKAAGKIGIPCFELPDGTFTLELMEAANAAGFSSN